MKKLIALFITLIVIGIVLWLWSQGRRWELIPLNRLPARLRARFAEVKKK